MTHDFSHAAMHRLTDWPVLARIAARQTTAKRLDSRAVAALYARASEADRREMNDAEREFADAALAAQSPILALQLHALRKLQALAKADGFKHLPDEKAFMDELSGEDDGIEVIFRDRFTMLTDDELAKARTWWAGLSEAEQMRRREHAVAIRKPFGIELPEDDDNERWPVGEGWAAVCYDDETA